LGDLCYAVLRSDDVALARREQCCENGDPGSVPNVFGTRWVVGIVLQQRACSIIKRHDGSVTGSDVCNREVGEIARNSGGAPLKLVGGN